MLSTINSLMGENVGKASSRSKGIIVVVLIVILLLAGGVYEFNNSQKTTTSASSFVQTVSSTAAIMKQSGVYKDGAYKAEGDYISPGGDEHINVSLTLKDGKIADVSVEPGATRPNPVKYQGLFVANYKPLVIGKNIDEVTLDVVSGSSLTPQGFNDALAKIKTQAKG